MQTLPELVSVPVAGGHLTVAHWGGNGPMVFGIHGVTANYVSWMAVAEQLAGDAQLVACDLRGRGASASLPGPLGMAVHADDVVAAMDHFGIDRAVVAGHSMGGYVTAVLGHRHPERLQHGVLIDGGLPLPLPEGLSVDEALELVVGAAMARLSMTFESKDAYYEFWRAHPALGPYWSELVERYVDYDLTGVAPNLRSGVDADAVRADTADSLLSSTIPDALAAMPRPLSLLRAERGMFDQVPPLFPDELAAAWPGVRDLGVVTGVNHYTILLAEHGAAAVATAIRGALAGSA